MHTCSHTQTHTILHTGVDTHVLESVYLGIHTEIGFLDSLWTQNLSLNFNFNILAKQAASELLGSPCIKPPVLTPVDMASLYVDLRIQTEISDLCNKCSS